MLDGLNKLLRKLTNTSSTRRRQGSGRPHSARTWWQRWFCKLIDFESKRYIKWPLIDFCTQDRLSASQ